MRSEDGASSLQPPASVGDRTERELIARIRQRLPPAPAWMLVGIGDDAAVVEPERNRVDVLSIDTLVDGVHFDRAFVPPDAIGHRALAVNLSDLAAMGAAPRLALVTMALPAALSLDDFDRIVGGLTSLAAAHRLHIAGGNLTRSPGPLMIDVAVSGTVKRRQALTRGGARAGDDVYVSGTIGAAAAGLAILRQTSAVSGLETSSRPATCDLRRSYLYPTPRVRLGVLLARNRAASACMDLSDGLGDGVSQISEASGVGMAIDADTLPIDDAARTWFRARTPDEDAAIASVMAAGDDYELLVTARPRMRRRVEAAARHASVPLTRIGRCTPERAVVYQRAGGDPRPVPRGYSHFRPVDMLRVVPGDVEGR